ncbi:hypothetical protein H0H92_001848 [Tricholoma furcatifolium]|nr:hypothetical protein H0H92_001848 [Tricholoma furcatifolium]
MHNTEDSTLSIRANDDAGLDGFTPRNLHRYYIPTAHPTTSTRSKASSSPSFPFAGYSFFDSGDLDLVGRRKRVRLDFGYTLLPQALPGGSKPAATPPVAARPIPAAPPAPKIPAATTTRAPPAPAPP